MSDYAKFSGQQRDWYAFKIKTEATAQVQGMAEVMRLKPGDEQAEIEHLAKRIDDNRVTCMFSILKRFTARGIALSKVRKYDESTDGALAWRDMKAYHDSSGSAEIYGATQLVKLTKLVLLYNSYVGMDNYINSFDDLCNKLEESGNPILDNQKKALLIANIKDSDYSAVCDMCADKDFMTTKATLHDKAIKLNKQSQGQRSSRKYNKISMNNYAKPGGKSNTNPSNKGNQSKESDGFRLSNDAWNVLSSENKRLWTKMRNAKCGSSSKRGGTPKYGKQ